MSDARSPDALHSRASAAGTIAIIERERDAALAALQVAREALDRIEGYAIDWAVGTAHNVVALQDIAGSALRALLSAPQPPGLSFVPRGHCNRCDRCGWDLGVGENEKALCRLGNCSMRPLPEKRTTCAGCGATYDDQAQPRTPAEKCGTCGGDDIYRGVCQDCAGAAAEKCGTCGGAKFVPFPGTWRGKPVVTRLPCPTCNGSWTAKGGSDG